MNNQIIEKTSLIVAGTTLLSAGISLCEKGVQPTGLALVILGVGCLVLRELRKTNGTTKA